MSIESQTLAEQAAELGQILGLEGPVPEPVVLAAIEDQAYAQNLLVCRREPELLAYLLANPPRPKREWTAAELIVRGAQAMAKWARVGFTVTSEEVMQRRLAACQACPELRMPAGEQTLLYKLIGTPASEKTVCGLCGCNVFKKVRLTTESCPSLHPTKPGYSRWDEPLVP